VILLAMFVVMWRAADEQARIAAARRSAADELINYMQYDLSKRLGKLGRLDMMNAINARIIKYHEDHPSDDLVASREKGVALIQQGDVQRDQGDLAGALKSYRDSLGIAEKLAKQDPANAGWQSDLSLSYERVGACQVAWDGVGCLC
jgi:hypothetical protein